METFQIQIIINIPRAHQILYKFIGEYIKREKHKFEVMPTIQIHM